jgi:cytoskeleton protein RodZ
MEPQRRIRLPQDDLDDEDAQLSTRQGVGEILRLRRESYGQDLPTAAAQLHIRLPYLRAVEDGRFRDLPGMAYAAGFIRSYGEYLGLDGEDLVRRFRQEVTGLDRQVRLSVRTAVSEGRFPGGAVLLLSGILALIAYGAWYYLSDRHKSFISPVPEVPAQLRAILGKEVPTNVSLAPSTAKPTAAVPRTDHLGLGRAQERRSPENQPQENPMAAASGQGSEAKEAPKQTPAGQVPEGGSGGPQSATSSVSSAPAHNETPAPAPPLPATSVLVEAGDLAPLPGEFSALMATARRAAGTGDGAPAKPIAEVVLPNPGARVKLVAHMDSWIQIADKTGKSYYASVLRAGQAVEVPNQPGLLLTVGNAGGLDVLVDGQVLPPLGGVGLVRRDLPLDPLGLKSTASIPH